MNQRKKKRSYGGPQYPPRKRHKPTRQDLKNERKRQMRQEKEEKKKVGAPEPLSLASAEQRAVIEAAGVGHSLVFFGEAGTGKSFIIKYIYAAMQRSGKICFVTAPTGSAAANLSCSSSTLHRFLGCGVGDAPTYEQWLRKIKKNRSAIRRLRDVQVLVIDELSFVHGRFLLLIDLLLRVVRNEPNRAFGGVQMILTGDFFQLPPVTIKEKEPWGLVFAFEVFDLIGFRPLRFDLTHVYRQASDKRFLQLLRNARVGRNLPHDMNRLRQCTRTVFPEGVYATKLFTRNADVDHANRTMMMSAPNEGETRRLTFTGTISLAREVRKKGDPGGVPVLAPMTLKRERLAQLRYHVTRETALPLNITIRAGMEVLVRRNLDEFVVNGTRGKVECWLRREHFERGSRKGEVHSYRPIDPATLEKIGVRVLPEDAMARDYLPVVRVPAHDDALYVFGPHRFEIPLGKSEVLLFYRIPLVAAWALTINKAQGITFDLLELNFSHNPWPAEGYVAVSRVRTLAGLKITGNLPSCMFRAIPKIQESFGKPRDPRHNGNPYDWPSLSRDSVVGVQYAKWLKRVPIDARMLKSK